MSRDSMVHLNGNILCAIDVGTTGTIPGRDSPIEVCILPIDSELKPNLKIMPFTCLLKPRYPEWCTAEHTNCNREKLCKAQLEGLDPDFAADLFDEWFQKLPKKEEKKISPLAHNWIFDRGFLIDWLGPINFESFFDARYRDPMPAALFQNDRADFASEPYPYAKVHLQFLASSVKYKNEAPHDCLSDCVALAEVYRRMVKGR